MQLDSALSTNVTVRAQHIDRSDHCRSIRKKACHTNQLVERGDICVVMTAVQSLVEGHPPRTI